MQGGTWVPKPLDQLQCPMQPSRVGAGNPILLPARLQHHSSRSQTLGDFLGQPDPSMAINTTVLWMSQTYRSYVQAGPCAA